VFKQTLVTQVAQRLLELPHVVFVVETGQRREPGGVCTAGKNQQRSAFGPVKAALTPSRVLQHFDWNVSDSALRFAPILCPT
jgi:hypothetical protein